ncbi:uncharacterized protein LOC131893040 [Tigriopus californicus]|uniref:uncharacterized protein LOC131893040 n=1 Tax=Tigriopus californicus TaxID=6832 RepID=UPI0027DAADE2|nr:uncharacterized protein LOC131893040 [Tigriopus californicus]
MVRRDKPSPSWANSSESRDPLPRHRHRRTHHHNNHQFHASLHSENAVTMLRSLHPKLDPNQTYVLSGPLIKYDETLQSYVHVFAARPIPPGMTVIATPSPSPPTPTTASSTDNHSTRAFPEPITLTSSPASQDRLHSTKFNPNALPFVPKTIETEETVNTQSGEAYISQDTRSVIKGSESESDPADPGRRTPCFMYWSSHCPEGTLVPLRQPDPPVYFQPTTNEAG